VIQPSACGGGLMLSALEQNTTTGDRMLRRSIRVPSGVVISAVASLLPTNSLSTVYCISTSFSSTWLPPHRSNAR
jgi:hypothetical protein